MKPAKIHETQPSHFKGKDAMKHVAETQAQGRLASVEIHGAEAPGHIAGGADAARETAILFILFGLLISRFPDASAQGGLLLLCLSFGWLIWKAGRSAWLGWQRLERLHRVIAEERWEIEHHREQEREELFALYAAKGFQGKLLEEVVDTLMADGDRLLRVMIEEELNLSLETEEHPLKQALGAGIGTLAASLFASLSFILFGMAGLMIASLITLGIAGGISAGYQKNRRVPAIVWNLGLGIATYGCSFFLLEMLVSH